MEKQKDRYDRTRMIVIIYWWKFRKDILYSQKHSIWLENKHKFFARILAFTCT